MADFQKKVNLNPALGIPGAFASVNPVVSTALGRIASADVKIGGFVWDDSANEGGVKSTGTGKPLGFVARNIIYPIYGIEAENNNIVPAGYNVNVMVEGDFYVEVAAKVTKGQKVFAVLADGTVKGGNAGTSVGGAVETDWAFTTAAEAGEIAVISNYGATPVGVGAGASVSSRTVEVVTNVTGENDTVTVTKDSVKVLA
jgi:hypothetical protein